MLKAPRKLSPILAAILTRCNTLLDLDQTALVGLVTRGWSITSGIVTLWLVASKLSPTLQGYFYAFSSLLALQALAELGLGQLVMQMASREAPLSSRYQLQCPGRWTPQLRSLYSYSVRWYGFLSVLVGVMLVLAGSLFFQHADETQAIWKAPWIAAAVAAAVSLNTIPRLALLEGAGFIRAVYWGHFISAVAGTVGLWMALAFGAKLWATAVSIALSQTVRLFWLSRLSAFFVGAKSRDTSSEYPWAGVLWPLQWKIALTWVSGYCLSSAYTPMAFALLGAREAGKVGMAWQIVNTISGAAFVWIQRSAPQMGVLAVRADLARLDNLVLRSTRAAVVFALLSGTLVVLGVTGLSFADHPLASRLLAPLPLSWFLSIAVLGQLQNGLFAYLRAQKNESLYSVAILQAIATLSMAWLLSTKWGTAGFASAAPLVMMCLALPLSALRFKAIRSTLKRQTTNDTLPSET